MFYTIYKIINKVNNKYYIGKHQTNNLDDNYMGSGHLLKRAIIKYGIDNFKKEVLFVFDNEEEMNQKEKELVVVSEQTYNLCEGGHGGFGYINKNKLMFNLSSLGHDKLSENAKKGQKNKIITEEFREKIRQTKLGNQYWLGKKHTDVSNNKRKETWKQKVENGWVPWNKPL